MFGVKSKHHFSIGDFIDEICCNINDYIADIDAQFEKATSLNSLDVSFLLFVTMLQTLRWILLPELKLPNMEQQLGLLKMAEAYWLLHCIQQGSLK